MEFCLPEITHLGRHPDETHFSDPQVIIEDSDDGLSKRRAGATGRGGGTPTFRSFSVDIHWFFADFFYKEIFGSSKFLI